MPTEIHRGEVQWLVAAGAQVVDVLPPEGYAELHIAGAVSIPLRQLNAESVARLDRNRPVIIYCHDFQ